MKDDGGKAIAWYLVSCKMTRDHVSDEKTVSILSLQFVPGLYFVPSLHFVLIDSRNSRHVVTSRGYQI